MIGTGGRVRALSAAAVLAVAAAGCTSGTQVRLVEKSMEPTVRSGEFVELDEFAYNDTNPERGDIISFRPPAGSEDFTCGVETSDGAACARPTLVLSEGTSLVKRVIAVPGDRIAIDADGTAVVNGVRLSEDYIIRCKEADECALPEPVVVPGSHYFVMGDNRPYSGDSRHFGPIDERGIEGKVTPPD